MEINFDWLSVNVLMIVRKTEKEMKEHRGSVEVVT